VGLVSVGVWMMAPAWGLIVGGVLLGAVAVLLASEVTG
jgi:hypothetical protein